MINRHLYKNTIWVDLERPTVTEIDSLMTEFNLDPEIAQELSLPTFKSKTSRFDDYIYLVLHFPAPKYKLNGHNSQEIDFVIGKNFLITTRYANIDAVEKFEKIFEVNSLLGKSDNENSAVFFFYSLMTQIFEGMENEIEALNDKLNAIEKSIFEGKEKEMVITLSKTNRDLLNFQNVIRSQQDVITDFEKSGRTFFTRHLQYGLSAFVSNYYKVENMLEKNINFLRELRETNNSLLSTKQNEIMKTLTIITFIAMPFSIITGLFQMNTVGTPLVGVDFDWQIVVGTELSITAILFIFARSKKWL